MGEEITRDAGGHAHRKITPGGLAYSVLKVRAEGVVVADKTAPVAPVAGHQGFAFRVEQVQHIGAGGRIELLQPLVECAAQQAVIRRTQQRLDIAVQRQHLGHRTEAFNQGVDRLRIQLQLPARLQAALLPGALLGITPGQPDARQQTEQNQQDDQGNAVTQQKGRHARLAARRSRHGKTKHRAVQSAAAQLFEQAPAAAIVSAGYTAITPGTHDEH